MATVTLTANTDYSALSLANDDTIDCAGFILTLDIQPTETGIQVTSPGTNGRVTFSDAWGIPTWDFFAGASTTSGMINTLPEGAEIRSITGGPSANNRGINVNNGIVGTATSGTGGNAYGIEQNNGHVAEANGINGIGVNNNNGTIDLAVGGFFRAVTTNSSTGYIAVANGGPGTNSNGVNTNQGHVGSATGGSGTNARGVNTNTGLVDSATGGSGGGSHGVGANNSPGFVRLATGSTSSSVVYGILTNNGTCLRIKDEVGVAVNSWAGIACVVEGPFVEGGIPSNLLYIYSIGELSESATISGEATVTILSTDGGGSGPSRPRQGNLIGRSF